MLALFKTFVTGIAELFLSIVSLFQFVINTLGSLLSFLANLPRYIAFATNSIQVLPTVIIPFALAAISIYFVLRLINRTVG